MRTALCIALSFASPVAGMGTAPTPPATTAIRLGLTLAVRPGEDPRDAVLVQRIEGEPWGTAWVVFEDGPDGAFISVFPDSDLTVLPE